MTDTFTPMTAEAAQEWIDALEGPYADRKGKNCLRDYDDTMCCLGVLADIKGDWDKGDRFRVAGEAMEPDAPTLTAWGIEAGEHNVFEEGDANFTGAYRLMNINDNSDTFAPVIAEIKRMFIDGVKS